MKVKISKKKSEVIMDLASDLIIAELREEEIVQILTDKYIVLGYDAVEASTVAYNAYTIAVNALKNDRRLKQHDQACTIDLNETYDITQHIRDLVNLHTVLDIDLDEELAKFRQKLQEFGWGKKQVSDFIIRGTAYTNIEFTKDSNGKRSVPRQLKEAGDRSEWNANRSRWAK